MTQIDVKPFKKGSEISAQDADLKRRKLFVKNLPLSCNNKKLLAVFSAFGQVDKAYVLFDHKSGTSRGFGFVEYFKESDLARALEKGVVIDGKAVHCSRVFLKQEVNEKNPIQQQPNKAKPSQSQQKPCHKNKNGKGTARGLSGSKVSAPETATQDSNGGNSEGEWDQPSPVPEMPSPCQQMYTQQCQVRCGRRFFSEEQWENYCPETEEELEYAFPLGPVGGLPSYGETNLGQSSYLPGPRSVHPTRGWEPTTWYSLPQPFHQPVAQDPRPARPQSYYRMF